MQKHAAEGRRRGVKVDGVSLLGDAYCPITSNDISWTLGSWRTIETDRTISLCRITHNDLIDSIRHHHYSTLVYIYWGSSSSFLFSTSSIPRTVVTLCWASPYFQGSASYVVLHRKIKLIFSGFVLSPRLALSTASTSIY